EPGLHANQPASGTRFCERLVAVVDLLAKDPPPTGTAPALAERVGILHRQCVADTLVQRAEHGETHLSGDRLHHAIGRRPRSDDRIDTRRQRVRRRIGREHRRNRQGYRRRDRRWRGWSGRRWWGCCRRDRCWWYLEGRAQKPIARVAAVDATMEQTVLGKPRINRTGRVCE